MPQDELDPAASTQMFQAFMDRAEEPEPSGSLWTRVALAVGGVVIVVALVWLLLGR